jgi:hypothetical protein
MPKRLSFKLYQLKWEKYGNPFAKIPEEILAEFTSRYYVCS